MSKTATRDAFGNTLAQLIINRDNIIVLDADLSKSTKTCEAKKARTDHYFNMGIAEANMMGVAAGLAASEKVVYASSFAMFAIGRAYEQIRNSIAYPNLNVKICATHAGISVGEDGASHQCIEDIALMRAMPNMKVFQPCDAKQTEMIINAVADIDGPCYIRMGRCKVEDVYQDHHAFTYAKGNLLKQGKKIAVIATGMMVQEALHAYEILKSENREITIVDMPCLKPLDEALIKKIAQEHDVIISCEEHSVIGGLGSAIAEVLIKHKPITMYFIGMQDCFGESGTPESLLKKYGLNKDAIIKQVNAVWKD